MTRQGSSIAGPHPDSKKGLQRAGWDMLWQVADHYDWSGGQVTPAQDSSIGVYSPLAYVEIATDLARVANGSEKIEDWVSAYGMLDWGSVADLGESVPAKSESRISMLNFADEVRGHVELIRDFRSTPDESRARRVQVSIERGLRRIHPTLIRNGSGTTGWSINFAWRIPTLRDVVMLHLADFAADPEAKVRTCEECGSFFVVTHGKQRYCPAVKGLTWQDRQGTKESNCALRARQRRYRTGRGRAK